MANPKETLFRQAQARHKRRSNDPNRLDDVSELVDFSQGSATRKGVSSEADATVFRLPTVEKLLEGRDTGLERDQLYTGPMFGIQEYPGFLFAPNALSRDIQSFLAYAAVTRYCEGPHVTNIDGVPPKANEILNTDNSMWRLWKDEQGLGRANYNEATQVDDSATAPTMSGTKRKSTNLPQRYYRCFRKLSWATTGYHYDWTARCYNKEAKSPIPTEFDTIGQIFAFNSWIWESKNNSSTTIASGPEFRASASIVNYYSEKSQMGPHRDDLEFALTKPIVSFSMGRPAVFLLGGKVKEDAVVPILVRPGDVMILGGDSRLNFHSMARLLPSDGLPLRQRDCLPSPEEQMTLNRLGISWSKTCNDNHACVDDQSSLCRMEEEALATFLVDHRININLRQVYQDDVSSTRESMVGT